MRKHFKVRLLGQASPLQGLITVLEMLICLVLGLRGQAEAAVFFAWVRSLGRLDT